MLETKEIQLLRKIVGKTKSDEIRNQQIKEFCNIQQINEWMERKTKKNAMNT